MKNSSLAKPAQVIEFLRQSNSLRPTGNVGAISGLANSSLDWERLFPAGGLLVDATRPCQASVDASFELDDTDFLRLAFEDPWKRHYSEEELNMFVSGVKNPLDDEESRRHAQYMGECFALDLPRDFPFDALAWYQPIHFFGEQWGICLKTVAVQNMATDIARRLPYDGIELRKLSRESRALLCRQCQRAAFLCLYFHESYHHLTESFAIRWAAERGDSSYLDYKKNVYRATFLTPDCLEESLANAYSYRCLKSSSVSLKNLLPAVRKATLAYLKKDMFPNSPPGYREALHYLEESGFRSGEKELRRQIRTGELRASSSAPGRRPENLILMEFLTLREPSESRLGASPGRPLSISPQDDGAHLFEPLFDLRYKVMVCHFNMSQDCQRLSPDTPFHKGILKLLEAKFLSFPLNVDLLCNSFDSKALLPMEIQSITKELFRRIYKTAYREASEGESSLPHDDARDVAMVALSEIAIKKMPASEIPRELSGDLLDDLKGRVRVIVRSRVKDHLRRKYAQKRGGGENLIPLERESEEEESSRSKESLDHPDFPRSPEPSVVCQTKENEAIVEQVLEHLDQRSREILTDRYLGEMSSQEVAEKHGINENSVRKVVQRALIKAGKVLSQSSIAEIGNELFCFILENRSLLNAPTPSFLGKDWLPEMEDFWLDSIKMVDKECSSEEMDAFFSIIESMIEEGASEKLQETYLSIFQFVENWLPLIKNNLSEGIDESRLAALLNLTNPDENFQFMELQENFDSLFARYSRASSFRYFEIASQSRSQLQSSFSCDGPGVYLIWKEGEKRPLYIGSAGKVSKKLEIGKSTVKKRMFQASTPYHFDKNKPILRFCPKDATVPPSGYSHSIPVPELRIGVFITPPNLAPAVLEHLLIQGFINQFGDLPEANQKI